MSSGRVALRAVASGSVEPPRSERFDRFLLRWLNRRERCAVCMRKCYPRQIIIHTLGVHFHRSCYKRATREELENITQLMEA